jgi:hypothetical protein
MSLAALLFESLGWEPQRARTKVVLSAVDNRVLTDWQRDNLRIAWAVRREPWLHEADAIARLRPPLNLATNESHPFYGQMKAARVRLRDAAVEDGWR